MGRDSATNGRCRQTATGEPCSALTSCPRVVKAPFRPAEAPDVRCGGGSRSPSRGAAAGQRLRPRRRFAGHACLSPECAGNTCLFRRSASLPPVHPRVCGEHGHFSNCGHVTSGPSPRVRGTRESHRRGQGFRRFIPACAGNTPPPTRACRHRTVHPRVCGEHLKPACRWCWRFGPSPRVRGTRHGPQVQRGPLRSIPACAGNTLPRRSRANGAIGPSPRVRGTPDRGHGACRHARSIPACAGNTSARHRRRCARSVHPRVCGEHASGFDAVSAAFGPSPRVRGTRLT